MATSHTRSKRTQGGVVLMPTDSAERSKRLRAAGVPVVRFDDAERCLELSADAVRLYFASRDTWDHQEKVFKLQSHLALVSKLCKWAVEDLLGGDIA